MSVQKIGAKVINHGLNGDFASARNFALSQVRSGWVLFVDADEVVTPALAEEIKNIPDSKFIIHNSFYVPRLDFMWGKPLKYGDANAKFVRLGLHDAGKWKGLVHEYWDTKDPGELKNPIHHYPHPSLYEFLRKINYYSTIRSRQFQAQGRTTNIFEIVLGPIWRFFDNYILKLGFLDGTVGFIHAMIMAFYMFLVASKSWLLSHPSS